MIEHSRKPIIGARFSALGTENTGRQQPMRRSSKLVMDAMATALKIRSSARLGLWKPVCIYDLADELGIEVRFVDIPSLEGMYCKGVVPLILVSSLRPSGRQTFTCAHELGHHIFNHGDHIDEIVMQATAKNRLNAEEFLVNCFAGFLLMPKSIVSHAFAIRGWDISSCTPLQCYTIAGWLGVGYNTLIQHMSATLRLISSSSARSLAKFSPRQIRSEYLGREVSEDLVIVDACWSERAIDIQVGDLIELPGGVSSEGRCISLHKQDSNSSLFYGTTPGRGRFYQPSTGWAVYVRVSRRGYTGRSIFRHLEDPDDD